MDGLGLAPSGVHARRVLVKRQGGSRAMRDRLAMLGGWEILRPRGVLEIFSYRGMKMDISGSIKVATGDIARPGPFLGENFLFLSFIPRGKN